MVRMRYSAGQRGSEAQQELTWRARILEMAIMEDMMRYGSDGRYQGGKKEEGRKVREKGEGGRPTAQQ